MVEVRRATVCQINVTGSKVYVKETIKHVTLDGWAVIVRKVINVIK